jgi:Sad1 / UNC-like C-terminal
MCCLKPIPPLEPVEDELLLSFEDWKAKQSQQAETKGKEKDSDNWPIPNGQGNGMGGSGNAVQEPKPLETSVETQLSDTSQEAQDNSSPHFRVPLTDRFNYASLDCSARVHTSHRSAKSSSSILSSKKDRYMLSPCASSTQEKEFVVVELCEDIRIDTVQLANFEFFSGVFKDFTVSVAKTYTTDARGWNVAATYTAKNVRGVQVRVLELSSSLLLTCTGLGSLSILLRHYGTFIATSASTFFHIMATNTIVQFLYSVSMA